MIRPVGFRCKDDNHILSSYEKQQGGNIYFGCLYKAPNLRQSLLHLFLPKWVILYTFHGDDLSSNYIFQIRTTKSKSKSNCWTWKKFDASTWHPFLYLYSAHSPKTSCLSLDKQKTKLISHCYNAKRNKIWIHKDAI